MTFPTVAVPTTNLDASGDDPSLARVDLKDTVDKINQIIAHVSTFGATFLAAADAAAAGALVSPFAAGTKMLFAQTSAPTGWTKSTTHNDKALRVVSGAASSGGTSAFTTAFSSRVPGGSINNSGLSVAATTLTTAQMPSHSHSIVRGNGLDAAESLQYASATTSSGTETTGANGGGGSHSHSIAGSSTFAGTALDFAVQYVDVIIATKD